MAARKSREEEHEENVMNATLEAAKPLFAEKRVETIVYGAVKVILLAVLAALLGLVIYAAKIK